MLVNQALHKIDSFILLGALLSRITAKTRTRLHRIKVEDEAAALLEYLNRAWGYYYTSTNEVPVGVFMEISGDKGKLVYHNDSLKLFLKNPLPEFTFSSEEI